MKISLENIKIGISQQLDALFGEGYSIYTEQIKQGLTPPAFYIKSLNTSSNQVLGNRYRRNQSLDIHFFPLEDGSENEQCENVADQLFTGMEYITVDGGLCRGTRMNVETVNGVLHFFVQYNMYVLKPVVPEESMGVLEQQSFTKG